MEAIDGEDDCVFSIISSNNSYEKHIRELKRNATVSPDITKRLK